MIGYQELIAIPLLIVSVIFVIRKFFAQVNHVEVDPKCMECPVPDLKRNIKN